MTSPRTSAPRSPDAPRPPAPRPSAARPPFGLVLTGLALFAWAVFVPTACAPEAPGPERPHVIVWLVDTLRADHLSAYGYERRTSPTIDRLADSGVLFTDAHVHANWTQPSVASLLSGRHPPTFDDGFLSSLPSGVDLVSEWLGEHGYETVGMTLTAATSAQFGFDKGFDVFREIDREQVSDRRERRRREGDAFGADRLVDAFLEWLEQPREPTRPFFAYLHTVDPHFPYGPHEGQDSFAGPYDGPVDGSLDTVLPREPDFSEADKRHIVDLYDDEILFNDTQLGRIVDALCASGLREHTVVVVVSDHGEEFWEREGDVPAHGHVNLHHELTRVPLVVSAPGRLPRGLRVEGLMRAVDLVPTLLDWIDVPPMPDVEGESVAAAVTAAGDAGDDAGRDTGADGATRTVRLDRDVTHYSDRARSYRSVMALRTDRILYHHDPEGARTGLYDLATDAAETVDLSEARPEVAAELAELLLRWRRASVESHRVLSGDNDPVELDAATRAALVELGYLQDDGAGTPGGDG